MKKSGQVYRKLLTLYLATYVIWFIVSFFNYRNFEQCYQTLFGTYLSYKLFQNLKALFIFLGLVVIIITPAKLKIAIVSIFELILLALIIMYIKVYSCNP